MKITFTYKKGILKIYYERSIRINCSVHNYLDILDDIRTPTQTKRRIIMLLGYFIIAFIVFFYLWKTKAKPAIDKGKHNDWVELGDFHITVWGSLFWIIALPMMLIWKLLEKITKL